jgi:hypothetical protein
MGKNIKFIYLYRDAGNYKNWGEVVFYNKNKLPKESVRELGIQSINCKVKLQLRHNCQMLSLL